MNIETITFQFEQTITSTLTMNVENGFVMPTTGKELVMLINEVSNQPHLNLEDAVVIDDQVDLITYDIEECK